MSASVRPWVTRLQIAGLCAIWGITLLATLWLGWSAVWQHRFHDSWKPALLLGAVVGGVFSALAGLLTYVFVALRRGEGDLAAASLPIPGDEALLRPITAHWRLSTWGIAALLAGLAAFAGFAWLQQLRHGMIVTGLNRPVFWGLYVTNVDFLLGLSYGAVLLSAALRLFGSDWRGAVSRTADLLAFVAICVAPLNIVFDLGRPDRMYKMFVWGRMESPLLWDVAAITTYLFTVIVYLYLPLIPDLAVLRDRVPGFRRHLYAIASFGWRGTPAQVKALDGALRLLAVVAIFVTVTVRSVIAWVNAMTVQPAWHSGLLAPAYVLNALGIAISALILALALERRLLRLSSRIEPLHFEKLGAILVWVAVFWGWFSTSEHLTNMYGSAPAESGQLWSRLTGHYAPGFWFTSAACLLLPLALLARRRWRSIPRTVLAAAIFLLGIWNELYEGIVATLEQPRLPYTFAHYHPSWVELSILVGCAAAVVLAMMIASRLLPVVPLPLAEPRPPPAPPILRPKEAA